MSISYRIWDLPELPVKGQVFNVPGAAYDGGFTSGGARISSPDPAGRSVLELQLAFQVGEWDLPFFSWLMSKTNGHIFRVRLTKTPQLVSDAALGIETNTVPWDQTGLMPFSTWDNNQNWLSDGASAETIDIALEGSLTLKIDMSGFGEVLRSGHVIGHRSNAYIVDEITYNSGVATVTINPPLRHDVNEGDIIYFRPYFLGTISNGQELKATYDSANVGFIQPGRIILSEVID